MPIKKVTPKAKKVKEIETPVVEASGKVEEAEEIPLQEFLEMKQTPTDIVRTTHLSVAIKFRAYFDNAFEKLRQAGQNGGFSEQQVKAMVEWAINTL